MPVVLAYAQAWVRSVQDGIRCTRGGEVELRIVDVPLGGQFAGKRTDIAGREGKASAELLLESGVELIAHRPAEVRIHWNDRPPA